MSDESSLSIYQREFKKFLLGDDNFKAELIVRNIAVPEKYSKNKSIEFAEKRLSIYRNNVIYSISEALGKLYPVTKRIVGDDCFKSIALAYAKEHAPEGPVLTFYGEYFPDYIAASESCSHLVYLQEVANLEWLHQLALHGENAVVFDPASLSEMDEEAMANLQFELCPSSFFIESLYPIDQIWHENQKLEVGVINLNKSQSTYLLIYRKEWQVQIVNLQCTVYHLLKSLAVGKSISDSWELAKTLTGKDALEDEEFSNVFVYLLGLEIFSQ